MTFANQKKTFLAKSDQSKKGSIDLKVVPIIETINQKENYYTTSSCSGRVYFWQGSGKKNETQWLDVSHDLITKDFFSLAPSKETIWLRYEPFILHVACKDLAAANEMVELARTTFKKSCILSISNKIIVEVRGSTYLETPWSIDGENVCTANTQWLTDFINKNLTLNWEKIEKLQKKIDEKF